MKSSPSIWHYVVSVKSLVKILSNFVAFLENTNFTFLDDHFALKFWSRIWRAPYYLQKKKTLFERSSSCFIYSIGMCRDYT